ncbi:hypothetical protein GCM10023238_24820 [Streptomyces heliomycini]
MNEHEHEHEHHETTRPAVSPPRSAPDASPAAGLRRELPAEVPAEAPAGTPMRAPAPAEEEVPEPPPGLTGRQRLVKGLWPPRVTRAQLIVALLLFGLGFGLAVQVASNSDGDSALRGARQEDLVRILDELDDRTERLEDEKQGLEKQRDELENSSDQAEEARKQTIEKERQLGVLAGTVAAQGPGITMTIEDAKGTVEADMLLDAVQELRAAGAEAIQVNGVRVVAGTYLTDSGNGVGVDGTRSPHPIVSRSSASRRTSSRRSTFPEAWCRLSKRNRPRYRGAVDQDRRGCLAGGEAA